MFGSASRWGIEAKPDPGVRFMDRTGDMPIRGVQIPRVVIVGGGFGGLYAAKGLSNEAVAVTLIDRKNHHTFQPLLYQVALGVLSPGEIASSLRRILQPARNLHTILGEGRWDRRRRPQRATQRRRAGGL
jgi:2-polyprenyl-6-methoxyphenol hydroxylase-like FAD-dependent oxidoreductase